MRQVNGVQGGYEVGKRGVRQVQGYKAVTRQVQGMQFDEKWFRKLLREQFGER